MFQRLSFRNYQILNHLVSFLFQVRLASKIIVSVNLAQFGRARGF
jgi:hypothetical protein